MHVFLTLVPRSRLGSELLAESAPLLGALARAGTALLGPRYRGSNAEIRRGLSRDGLCALSWTASPSAQVLTVRRGRWALCTSADTSSRILDSAFTNAGGLWTRDPVHGHYLVAMGDKETNRQYYWNTTPAHETAHYGHNDHLLALSNRPILAALALANGAPERIRLDEEAYLAEYLSFGFSVSGATPFAAVRTLSPRRALSVTAGHALEIPAPPEPTFQLDHEEHEYRTGAQELQRALLSSTERYFAARDTNSVQVCLSGGMDSRLLLGLLRQYPELRLSCFTHGGRESEEVRVAALLAERAGLPFHAGHAAPYDSRGFIESMRASIAGAQGLIPSESHIAPWAGFVRPLAEGQALAAGQWPLFKGATLDKSTRAQSIDFVDEKLRSVDSRYGNTAFNQHSTDVLQSWARSVPALDNLDILYAYSRDIRSTRYLHPHYFQADGNAQVFYPFMDSEVAAVADALPRRNRIENVAAFLTMASLWPESTTVPLANGARFRFEMNEPLPGVSGDGWKSRTGPVPEFLGHIHDSPALELDSFTYFTKSPLTGSAKYLRRSDVWPNIAPLLSDSMGEQVNRLASCEEMDLASFALDRNSRRTLHIGLWRAILVDQWMRKEWLSDLSRPTPSGDA